MSGKDEEKDSESIKLSLADQELLSNLQAICKIPGASKCEIDPTALNAVKAMGLEAQVKAIREDYALPTPPRPKLTK